MRLTITGTPDLSPDCTTPDTGEPAGTYGGHPYWRWTNDAGTWNLVWDLTPERYLIVSDEDIVWTHPYWICAGGEFDFLGAYTANMGAIGTVTVTEYSPIASVVTNILLGSTVETCKILNSRIVRGPV